MAETGDSIAETHRQTHVSVRGYITDFHVSVAAFIREVEHFFPHVSDRFPFQESRISAVVNVCLCCGNAKFGTGNLLFRPFFWWKHEDTMRQPDWFFRVSVRFGSRFCANTSKKFHTCGNQVFRFYFFLILT